MRFGEFPLQAVTGFVRLALALIHITPQGLLAFTMADLTGAVNHCQRALDVVVAELYAALTLVRHMTVRARHASLSVYARLGYLIARMLRLQYAGAAQLVGIVRKIGLVIISLHILHRKPLVPREGQIFAVPFEIILYVALGTYQRAHFLRSRLADVFSLTLKSFDQSGTADLKIHILRFVTVGAADGVHYLAAESRPFVIIERLYPD